MLFSSDRGQTEPLAALVAVFALGLGLSLYVGVLDSTLPLLSGGHKITPTAADRLVTEGSSFGVIDPPITGSVAAARPTGYHLNGTVGTEESVWTGGPPRIDAADCVVRSVRVRTAPGRIRRGILEVCVWPVR